MKTAERVKNKSPGSVPADQGSTEANDVAPNHTEIVSRTGKPVKANWLRAFHVRSGLTAGEIVELIRPLYPSFDKTLLVKCENPEKYGIRLSQRAIRQLKEWEKKHV